MTEKLRAEYDAFCMHDLGEHRIVHLDVDGIAERLRAGRPREAVLAWRSARTAARGSCT